MNAVLTDLHPAEYVAALLVFGDIEGAERVASAQYALGFRAALNDAPYADFRPTNWQRGWLDAFALQGLGPMFAAREGIIGLQNALSR